MKVTLALLFIILSFDPGASAQDRLVVANKTFTESRLLAEIMAQMIEAHTDLTVERKKDLGGTLICFSALEKG